MAAVARLRIRNALERMIGTLVATLVAVLVIHSMLPLYWYVGHFALMLAERAIFRRVLARCEAGLAPQSHSLLALWTFGQSLYVCGLGAILWLTPYAHGQVLALLYLLAGIVNAAATLRGAPLLAAAGAGGTTLYLIALPLADFLLIGRGANPHDLFPLLGVVMFLLFCVNMWRALQSADAAQAAAEDAAIRERKAFASAAAAKSDMVRRMRDEMRTPLAAVAGAAEHLRRARLPGEAQAHVETMLQASEVLRTAIADFSDLDHLESGQLKIAPRPCDPRDLVRNVVAAFRSAAHDKGLELFLDIAEDVPGMVEIDPVRVRQILANLLSNAVRYTSNGGVRVRLQARPGATAERVRLGFAVADTGIGMSRSKIALLFGREGAPINGESGGLGLPISIRLARLMGGQIAARSELGQGTMASFVLEAPIVAAERARESAA